ncbi:MAG: pentapeptide repeat-containing protein [Gemmatimonadetes bacterium]|nr:pentapeptide repeat-containing protein [Gemmatimonadota bacterium]
MHGADLKQANLTGAYPYKAEFASADLRGTDFTNAYCNEADFSNAVLGETNFSSTNLTNAIGLESCTYSAPVFADSVTLLKSGSLPVVFLEHCVYLPEKDHDMSNRLN